MYDLLNGEQQRRTFDGDVDDVVRTSQPVGGDAAVPPSIAVRHVRNPEGLLKVLQHQAVGGQLPSFLHPGDVRRGPKMEMERRVSLQPLCDLQRRRTTCRWRFIQTGDSQALGEALQLQGLSSQDHLVAGGALRQHDAWTVLLHRVV